MRKIYLPARHLKALFIFCSFLLFAFWANATTYYLTAAGAGNAQTPASWNTIAGGGGVAAANFTTNGDIFNIPVGINGTLGAGITLGSGSASGSGVALQVLGSLTINDGIILTLAGKNANESNVTVSGTIIFLGTSKVSLSVNNAGMFFTLSSGATLKTQNTLGILGTGCSIEKTGGANRKSVV